MNRRGFLGAIAGFLVASRFTPRPLRRIAYNFKFGDGEYVYVRAAKTLTSGSFVFWEDRENAVVTPLWSGATTVAGVAVAPIDAGNLGFIQVKGETKVNVRLGR
jgi:hypothetical protein